jgi:hypothetical protein
LIRTAQQRHEKSAIEKVVHGGFVSSMSTKIGFWVQKALSTHLNPKQNSKSLGTRKPNTSYNLKT